MTFFFTTMIATSSADHGAAHNFVTQQYAPDQGPTTANTYDPYHHNLASDSVVWAHPVFRPLMPLVAVEMLPE